MVAVMRKIFLLALLTVSARADVIDGVAAICNDKVITYGEVRNFVQPLVAQLRRTYTGSNLVEKIRAAQVDSLNNLIDRALILDEFKSKGFSFPETIIEEQFNATIANDFGGDRTAFIKTLQAENLTVAKYREQLRDRIIVQAMRNRKTSQDMVVSPYRIEVYYKEHLEDYKTEEQIKLRMIFIKKTPMPPVEAVSTNGVVEVPVDPKKKMADEIVAKLEAGDSFDGMAKLYSDGKEAKQGGDWGWISREVLRKELGDVAFSLKAGQHSQVIDTADGYYILQVESVKPSSTRPLTEVRDEIEKILLQQERTKTVDAWIKSLRAKAYIRIF
jgi:parvulin-like peptidyl-prolyl isomerase